MFKPALILTTATLFALSGCNKAGEAQAKTTQNTSALAPIKSNATAETTNLETQMITDGLKAPWGLAFLPDGGYVVTEKTGGIVRVAADGTKTQLSGIPQAYVASQGGLMDVVISPDFTTDNTVYVTYAYGDRRANGTAVFKATLGEDSLTGETIFKTSPPKDTANHYGARMAFMPDGNFILTMGDGYSYREEAQSLDNHFGKTLRLTPEGEAAPGNPFIGKDGALPEIYSYGHRNPQGLIYDGVTNTVWLHEHGPKGGDEINKVEPSLNYGWPVATFGIDYSGAQISPFETYKGMTDSIYYWKPSIAPSGMAMLSGDMFADWSGDLLVGGLASRDLRRVKMENGRAVSETILLDDLGLRIRDVRVGPDGAIYVLTDEKSDGKLIRVTPQ